MNMVTFDKKGITFDCEDIKARVEIDASKMLAQLEELFNRFLKDKHSHSRP